MLRSCPGWFATDHPAGLTQCVLVEFCSGSLNTLFHGAGALGQVFVTCCIILICDFDN